jgi:ATP-dependent RNA helicase DeaD
MDSSPTDAGDGFAALGLAPELLDTLDELGYEEPTPVQRETIPHLLAGRDLVGQAATGTGKTAAFALPLVQSLPGGRRGDRPTALVLVPTRELAMQVSEAMFKYGKGRGVRVVPVYGGQPIHRQLHALERGVDIVVGTPGRLLDHLGRRSLAADRIATVVLDEADEMLDMGFADDLEAILAAVPTERQTVLFSATMPPRIAGLARRFLADPVRVSVGGADDADRPALITQRAHVVQRAHKPAALGRVLDIEAPEAAIVFCRTRTEVDLLTETMNGRGYRAEALHGGMDQAQRDRVMGRLRDGTAELLIATDVAARGLDVDTLTHVVNYDVPSAPDSYVHRIGRVGRAGRRGVAITLAEPRERRLLDNIVKVTRQAISIEPVPSVAELRARQAELTAATVRQALESDDLDDYGDLLAALGDDGDVRSIALAAIKLVHEASGATADEPEIPAVNSAGERRGARPARDRDRDRSRTGRSQRPRGEATGFVQISLGRRGGVRPADLVGAIANEARLTGADIGPIRINENSSIVGVPVGSVDAVVSAMSNAVVRGKTVGARRFVERPAPDRRRGDARSS